MTAAASRQSENASIGEEPVRDGLSSMPGRRSEMGGVSNGLGAAESWAAAAYPYEPVVDL